MMFLARLINMLINPGKSRDALYENVLAENEREAVADLLQYLENVRAPFIYPASRPSDADLPAARRNRLLFGRTSPGAEHTRLFG